MTPASWAWSALTLYVLGLVLAFGVRTWTHWRATASTGFRGFSGRPGSIAWWGGVLFPVALVLDLAAPVLVITETTAPVAALLHPEVGAAGLLLALTGLALVLAAQQAMGPSWRIGVHETERTQLVIDGLFARVRNPIFTGMAALSLGVLLMVPTLVAAFALACLVAALQIQVRAVEEPYLHRTHGDTYVEYIRRSGRFLPSLLVDIAADRAAAPDLGGAARRARRRREGNSSAQSTIPQAERRTTSPNHPSEKIIDVPQGILNRDRCARAVGSSMRARRRTQRGRLGVVVAAKGSAA